VLTDPRGKFLEGQNCSPFSRCALVFRVVSFPLHNRYLRVLDWSEDDRCKISDCKTFLSNSKYSGRGVEFSQKLSNIAEANIAKHPKPACGKVFSIHEDAALFDLPPDNLVIYLYHPFEEAIFRRVLDNLACSLEENDRRIYIIYFNPLCAHLLDAMTTLSRVDLLTSAAVYTHQAPATNSSN